MKQSQFLNQTDIELSALNAAVNGLRTAQNLLSQQVQGLSNQVATAQQQNPNLRNLLRNGDYNYSLDAYDNFPMVGGDPGFEAKSWYRHKLWQTTCSTTATSATITSSGEFTTTRFGATNYAVIYGAGAAGETLVETLTRVDNNTATLGAAASVTIASAYIAFGEDLDQTAALAVHAIGYSTYAANEGIAGSTIPIWDKDGGQCWFGQGTGKTIPGWGIDQPLTLNLGTAGQFVYVPFIMKLRRPTECFVGIISAGTTVTATTPVFTIDDVGANIFINGAGVAGARLDAGINTYISPTQVTITVAATTTVVAATTVIGDNLDDVVFFAGIWADDRWAEGEALELTATKTGAHAGGSTTRVYYVVAETDWGQFVASDQITVTNTLATLDANNSVTVTCGSVTGALGYSYYRQTGTTYRKIAFVPQTTFYDTTENAGSVQPGFPIPDANTLARAYVEFDLSTLPDDQKPVSTEWRPFGISIPMPSTYQGATTILQWLRFGLATATNVGRQLLLDRIGISTIWGAWTISTLDADALNPADGNPSGSDQGPTTGGITPGAGTGIGTCLVENTKVARRLPNGRVEYIPMKYLTAGNRILGRNGSWVKIRTVTFWDADETWELKTANGVIIHCTDTHKLIAPRLSDSGTAVSNLDIGDWLLTWVDAEEIESHIVSKTAQGPSRVVHIALAQAPDKFGYQYAAGEAERMVFQSNSKILPIESPN